MINIAGYDLLGGGKDGVRFAWKSENSNQLIESAAFVNKTKNELSDICGYTTSVSMGCILRQTQQQCRFCRTGNNLPFLGLLTDKEIAKQNIFMVLSDMYCDDHPALKWKKREFAYMGQGEPGFSYSQVRSAIEITNAVMRELGQTVYRHIFATSGVPMAIEQYISDLQDFFTEKVTLHFSLHATKDRDLIMPINNAFPYQESIRLLNKVAEICSDKPCVGIMLFNEYSPCGINRSYSNTKDVVLSLVNDLSPEKCRLSFCEFNASPELGTSKEYSPKEAIDLLQTVKELGFEAKLFSSFGRAEYAACGMLGGKSPEHTPSKKWIELDSLASELVESFTK